MVAEIAEISFDSTYATNTNEDACGRLHYSCRKTVLVEAAVSTYWQYVTQHREKEAERESLVCLAFTAAWLCLKASDASRRHYYAKLLTSYVQRPEYYRHLRYYTKKAACRVEREMLTTCRVMAPTAAEGAWHARWQTSAELPSFVLHRQPLQQTNAASSEWEALETICRQLLQQSRAGRTAMLC